MIRQDYIMRLVEQLGVLFQRIFNKNLSNDEVDAGIDALFNEWVGLPPGMLLSLSADDGYRLLEQSNRMLTGKCYLMAEVCRAKGLLADSETVRRQYFEKALFFYEKCSAQGDAKLQPEIDRNVAALTAEIAVLGKEEGSSKGK
jgi:hypothetical protein